MKYKKLYVLAVAVFLLASSANAEDAKTPVFNLTIKDHKFQPATLEVPANTKFELHVKNEDTTAEEFESDDLSREKIIPGGKEAIIHLGPLKPKTYGFYGEFNADTAQGQLIAK